MKKASQTNWLANINPNSQTAVCQVSLSRLISVDLDVPPAGLEPAPHSLRVYCSTN